MLNAEAGPKMIQFLLLLISIVPACEGAIQNFSVSFDANFSQANQLSLQQYGGMPAYVAFMPESSIDTSTPSAWLLFVQVPANSSQAGGPFYVLASYVFPSSMSSSLFQGAIVWMANRHRLVSGNFSLTLNQTSGSLVLRDGDGSVAWVSNDPPPSRRGSISMDFIRNPSTYPPVGTLALTDASNSTLWQSSDYPTDTLAITQFFNPGMSLTSWATASDPSEGLFRLVMEAGGLALYYNSSLPYWIWSYYDRNDTFGVTHTCSNLTQAFMSPDGALLLGVTSILSSSNSTAADLCSGAKNSQKGAYFDDYGTRSDNEFTFMQLQHDGNLVASTLGSPWVTVYDLFLKNRCFIPNYCGLYGICTAPSNCQCPPTSDGSFPQTFPSNRSQGCPPIRTVGCSSTAEVKFEPLSGVDYFANKYLAPVTNLSTPDLCQAACLQNCLCLAAFWHAHTGSCFHSSDMSGLEGSLNSSYMAFIKVEHISKSDSNRRLIIGLVSGAAALLAVMSLAAIVIRQKRRASLEEDEEPFWSSVPGLPHRYSYKELESITKGFSEKMGKGGFGTVYAGALHDGTKVAVKSLDRLGHGKKEFRAEVVILGGVHHYNLVKLMGFCAEGSHRLLVYEYMVNGSLEKWLPTKSKAPLEWKHRFNIACGAARGLAYLHGACKDTIVHLDIKPENILLDEEFEAKVADFGLSTLMGRKETHVITTMRGTPGYLAPEWVAGGSQISAKCDVFSFGKVLMEILGSRRNLEPSLEIQEEETDKTYFPSWLYLQTAHQGKEVDLTHIAGVESAEERRQAAVMLKTSFLCVLENPSQRPSMEKVVHMLEGRVPELEDLNLAEIFQGLRFALGMPEPNLANKKIDEALASLYRSDVSLESTTNPSCYDSWAAPPSQAR